MTGALIAFTVEAMGDSLQFQWQKDGKGIDRDKSRLQCSQSDNTSTLCIQQVEKSDQGHYKCLVTNPVEKNGKSSHVAELTVREFVFVFFLCVVLAVECWLVHGTQIHSLTMTDHNLKQLLKTGAIISVLVLIGIMWWLLTSKGKSQLVSACQYYPYSQTCLGTKPLSVCDMYICPLNVGHRLTL